MEKREKLVVIVGPTATGKTDLSIMLAEAFDGEIVVADSMQIYKGMDIGTATPTKKERRGIEHHLLSSIPPDREYSVADFQKEARRHIREIRERGKRPFLVGGTGLYIRATLEDFIFPPLKKDELFRKSCQEIVRERGSHIIHQRLQEIDLETAKKIHPHDQRRIIRSLEIYHQTKKTPSYFRDIAKSSLPLYETLKVGLTAPREDLYQRIERRAEEMIEKGFVNEVLHLLEAGLTRDAVSMQSLGYRELAAYLEGELSFDEALSAVKRNTRHFAKRQLTWFRKEKDIHWFSITDRDKGELFQRASLLVKDFLSHG